MFPDRDFFLNRFSAAFSFSIPVSNDCAHFGFPGELENLPLNREKLRSLLVWFLVGTIAFFLGF